eukprot:gene10144-7234_t
MNLYVDSRLLNENLSALIGKDADERARAAAELKAHVELAARELSLERFSKFEFELHHNILILVNTGNLNEKMGGILAIRELIDCTSAAAETKIIKFAKALSNALGAATDFTLIELIADAFGHMAKNSPVSHRDYLEGELIRALDSLKGKQPSAKRFAACVMLQQLATNAPTIFFVKINEFFDLIWIPIWDQKETIRNAAGRALSACLAVLKERTYHLQWYCFIYDQLQEGFLAPNEELVHGSLLVVAEMLKYTGDFMIPRFKEVCRSLMQLKNHKSKLVKQAIIDLLPSLAHLCPDVFARAHMDESIDFLIKCTRTSELRSAALLSIGKMCTAMGTHMVNRMDELLQVLREILSNAVAKKSGKGIEIVPGALTCVSDMVQGLGIPFHAKVYSLLEPMIQTGLTAELIETLAVISSHMPSQKQLIQSRLLEEATKVLGGNLKPPLQEPEYMYSWARVGERTASQLASSSTGLRPASNFASTTTGGTASRQHNSIKMKLSSRFSSGTHGAPVAPVPATKVKSKKTFSFFRSSSSSSAAKSAQAVANAGAVAIGHGTGLGSEADVDNPQIHSIVILSLKTLATLTIPQFESIVIMQQSVLPYFMSDSYLVRKEAAVTLAKMTGNLIQLKFTKGPTALVIEENLTRLLEVALSDISTQTRLEVLRSFVSAFDPHLSRSHHVESLMMLLADELFDIRLEALNVLGRLASSNPAAVLPTIRIHLAQIISEMISLPDYRALEEAASMLCRFMQFTKFHFLVRPVMSKVLDCLPLRSDLRTTSAALETVGELSLVLNTDLLPYTDKLLPIIISNMFDNSSIRKQQVAVRTLGQLVKSTGLVVRPYLQFPQLLPKTLDLLCRGSPNQEDPFRLEILRTVGLIGALEPTRYMTIVAFLQTNSKEKKSNDGDGETKSSADRRLSTLATMLPLHVNSIDRERESKVSFSMKDGGGGGPKERDRSESNVSMLEKSTFGGGGGASNKQLGQPDSDWTKSERAGTQQIEEDVIQTDKLLFADSADAPSYLFMYEQSFMRSIPEPPQDSVITAKHSPSSEDFYPRVALAALVNILQDPSLAVHHSTATQTIIQIFAGLGVRCVQFLDQIVPYFLQIVRKSGSGLRESILQQLSQLVHITGQYITPYLPQILEILRDYWDEHLEFVLAIVQQVSSSTNDAFEEYLESLLPLLLSSLEIPRDVTYSSLRSDMTMLKPLEEVLQSVKFLRIPLQSRLHLFIPKLCSLLNQLMDISSETVSTQLLVTQTIFELIRGSRGAVLEQTNHMVSSLVHTVCKVMMKGHSQNYQANVELQAEGMNVLVVLAQQIGRRMLMFDSLVMRTTEKTGVDNAGYREVMLTIRASSGYDTWMVLDGDAGGVGSPVGAGGGAGGGGAAGGRGGVRSYDGESTLVGIGGGHGYGGKAGAANGANSAANPLHLTANVVQKYPLNMQQLARSWDVSQRSTANDWHEWLWRFNVDLLRESPIPTLRSCAALAQNYPPMAKELFHAAFYSCWRELSDPYRDSLVRAFQTAFKSPTIPSEILQYLLNLAEFMEHDVEALPINESILAELAQKGHAYAKALHYREIEFVSNPASSFETLININKKLDQYEAASGLLKVATQIQKKLPEFKEFYKVQESWLAKLGYWDEALLKYEEKLQENPKDSVAIAGKMKCLEALGRWEDAVKLCEEHVDHMRIEAEHAKTQTHVKAAVIGARAAWSLNEWDLMDDFVSHLPADNVDGSFMKAVLAVHAEKYTDAQKHLEVTRKHLDKMITSLMSESYGRAYMPLIMVQQCSELEEITEYQMFLKENGLAGDADLDLVVGSISLEKFSMEADASAVLASLEDHGGIPRQAYRRKMFLSEKWRRRIRGCASTGRAAIPYWKYLLNGRRMILSEKEDLDTWLDFVSLCRNGGNTALAERVLTMSQWSAMSPFAADGTTIGGGSGSGGGGGLGLGRGPMIDRRDVSTASAASYFGAASSAHGASSGSGATVFGTMSEESLLIMERRIKFAMLKQKWATGSRQEALTELDTMVKNMPASLHAAGGGHGGHSVGGGATTGSHTLDSSYLSSLLKLGEWKTSILDPGKPVDLATRMEVLALYARATALDSNSYRAAHQWGLANYRAGFTRSLCLGTRRFSSSVMQDMLCILSLWFQHGKYPDVIHAIEQGLAQIPLDNWLGVLPQLIARIDHPDKPTRALLHTLIMRLGAKHPQALVYPLSVALKNPRGDRKEAAEQLMTGLRQHSTKLIDQAVLVSQELVRVAILWEEWWHWVLEDASRLCYGDGNIQGMLEMLEPLHEAVEKGPATLREAAFIDTYKFELHQAWECLQMYRRTMEERRQVIPTGLRQQPLPPKHHQGQGPVIDDQYIQQAWELYYSVFKRINGQINTIHSLDLQSTSPALFAANDLDIGVPGTYQVNGSAVRIKSFNPVVMIIRSKQRPRKIRIMGEDGQEYVFLLKGHEDLRQDERAMQLFGLVNALLYHDRRTGVNSEDLQIQRYCVMPLSPSVGLIGWVPACDTLHDLIRSYRDSRKTLLDMEAKLITQAANNQFEKLPVMHKLEVFEYAISFTQGEDLAKILWLKSENSESWLQRRATYTRSLAVMSMVGYILGLGDRHPSNLMLDKKTGKVLHIDFGDCFEVAMHREKFPEKVPFRLTRMLVSAMEVAGIEGNFRSTCEKVMAVLRENRDSLVATLEAFPIIPLNPALQPPLPPILSASAATLVAQQHAAAAVGVGMPPSPLSPTAGGGGGAGSAATMVVGGGGPLLLPPPPGVNLLPSPTKAGHGGSSGASTMVGAGGAGAVGIAAMGSGGGGVNGGANGGGANSGAGGGGVSTATTLSSSVIRGDIHMEIAKLSAKTFDKQSSQVMSASMRHHSSSLSSIAMSQRLSSLRSTATGGGAGVAAGVASTGTSEASQQMLMMTQQEALLQQELTEKAVVVIRRVLDKLNGLDFASSLDPASTNHQLGVAEQVERLIQEATSNENLSQSFFGWLMRQ